MILFVRMEYVTNFRQEVKPESDKRGLSSLPGFYMH